MDMFRYKVKIKDVCDDVFTYIRVCGAMYENVFP